MVPFFLEVPFLHEKQSSKNVSYTRARHKSYANMSLFFHRLDDKNYYELPRLGGYLKSVYACVCLLSLRNSERTRWCTQITPDEHPRRHVLADGLLSSLYAPSLSLSSFGAASVMMFCSACPASSGVLSVVPEDRIGRNIMYVRRFCDRINVHVVDHACIVGS